MVILLKRRIYLKKEIVVRKNLLKDTSGKIGWVLLWLIGVPIPVLLFLFLIRGCT